MNEFMIINIFFFVLFVFLFGWQIVVLFAIRNASLSSRVKTPFIWNLVSVLGILFSLTLIIMLISSVLTNL